MLLPWRSKTMTLGSIQLVLYIRSRCTCYVAEWLVSWRSWRLSKHLVQRKSSYYPKIRINGWIYILLSVLCIWLHTLHTLLSCLISLTNGVLSNIFSIIFLQSGIRAFQNIYYVSTMWYQSYWFWTFSFSLLFFLLTIFCCCCRGGVHRSISLNMHRFGARPVCKLGSKIGFELGPVYQVDPKTGSRPGFFQGRAGVRTSV